MKKQFISEPEKRVPVLFDTEVVVVGAGTSGIFAALGAAEMGAKVVVVDRFFSLGGDLGSPGLINMGTIDGEAEASLVGGLSGLPKKVIDQMNLLIDESPRSGRQTPSGSNCANTISYITAKMVKDLKIKVISSVYASDPIIDKDHISGVFIETPCGRKAIKAKVTVDASGQADIARRAGCGIIERTQARESFKPIIRGGCVDPKYRYWNDTSLKFVVSGIDTKEYQSFIKDPSRKISKNEVKQFLEFAKYPDALKPIFKEALEKGEYNPNYKFDADSRLFAFTSLPFQVNRLGYSESWVELRGEFDISDSVKMSEAFLKIQEMAYEAVKFYRNRVPGFKNAFLHFIAPYLGARGGPCVEAEHMLTPEEAIEGARFDDVVYVNTHEALHGGAASGYDVPYRILLPKGGFDGILVTGKGAGYIRRGHDPSGIRCRPCMQTLGQITGIAAALAVETNSSPKKLDIKILQRKLLEQDIYLGTKERLEKIGLT